MQPAGCGEETNAARLGTDFMALRGPGAEEGHQLWPLGLLANQIPTPEGPPWPGSINCPLTSSTKPDSASQSSRDLCLCSRRSKCFRRALGTGRADGKQKNQVHFRVYGEIQECHTARTERSKTVRAVSILLSVRLRVCLYVWGSFVSFLQPAGCVPFSMKFEVKLHPSPLDHKSFTA